MGHFCTVGTPGSCGSLADSMKQWPIKKVRYMTYCRPHMFCAVSVPQTTVSAACQARCASKPDDFDGFLRIAWSVRSTSRSTGSARSNHGGQSLQASWRAIRRLRGEGRNYRSWSSCPAQLLSPCDHTGAVVNRTLRWPRLPSLNRRDCMAAADRVQGSLWVPQILLGLVERASAKNTLSHCSSLDTYLSHFAVCFFRPFSNWTRSVSRSRGQDERDDGGQAASTASSPARGAQLPHLGCNCHRRPRPEARPAIDQCSVRSHVAGMGSVRGETSAWPSCPLTSVPGSRRNLTATPRH